MKAHVASEFGSPTVFKTIDLPKPALKPGYVLIKVEATSVNPIDCKLRAGLFPQLMPAFPAILHGDIAGRITAVGPGVTTFNVGDEVFGCAGGIKGEAGALAEYILADAKLLAKKPQTLNMRETAALPLVCITAWEALFEKIQLKPDQKVLVHAGAGGVGHIAIQLAKWAGAKVYATVSTPEKAAIAKQCGAIETIYYREESVESYVERLTAGKGFDVVFDTVGGENIDASIKAVALYGDVITILAHSSHDLSGLFAKSANLHIVFMLLPLICNEQRERHGHILQKIAELVNNGYLKPFIDARQFSFANIADAHALQESGKAIGKIIAYQTD